MDIETEIQRNTNPRTAVLLEQKRLNQMRICEVDGCQHNRYQLARYCSYHYRRTRLVGDPVKYDVTINHDQFTPSAERLKRLIEFNCDRPGIVRGVQWVRRQYDLSLKQRRVEGIKDKVLAWVKTLAEAQVGPIDILATIGAVSHVRMTRGDLFGSENHFTLTVGKQIFWLTYWTQRKMKVRTSTNPLWALAVGKFFLEELAQLGTSLAISLQKVDREEAEKIDAYKEILVYPKYSISPMVHRAMICALKARQERAAFGKTNIRFAGTKHPDELDPDDLLEDEMAPLVEARADDDGGNDGGQDQDLVQPGAQDDDEDDEIEGGQ
jgi:hypothetical protein